MRTTGTDSQPALSLSRNAADIRSTVFAGGRHDEIAPGNIAIEMNGPAGDGRVEFVEFDDDFNVILSDCHWKQDGFLTYRGEGWVRLNFCLDTNAVFSFGGHGAFALKGPELRLFHQPEGVECGHEIKSGARSACVTLSIRRDRLRTRLEAIPQLSRTVFGGLDRGGDGEFFFRRYRQGAETLGAVNALLNAPYSGALRRAYVRAKSEELLCSAFNLALEDESAGPVTLRPGDAERLDRARAVIDADIAAVPSLRKLAHAVGLNRTKLAYGFRHRFGTSVGSYVLETRLSEALRLLNEGLCRVTDVAEAVGYSSPAAFSTAFKRRYGISPRAAMRRR